MLQDKDIVSKMEKLVERQYADWHLGIMENIDGGQKQRSKKATETEELVKYMSDLPCYLQRVGRGGNIQEKALNFGVLDWNRLERWKCEQKRVLSGSNVQSPSSSETLSSSTYGLSTQSGRSDSETNSLARKKQSPSLDFYLNLSAKEGHSQVPKERSSKQDTALHDLKTASKRDQSIGRQRPSSEHEKSNRNYLGSTVVLRNTCQISEKSSNSKDYAASTRAKGKTKSRNGESERRVEQGLDSDPHLLKESCVNGLNTYEFLSVTEFPKDTSPENCLRSEHSAFHNERLKQLNRKSFSEDYHFMFTSSSDIPHSSPFPCNSKSSEWPDIKAGSSVDVRDTEIPSNVCCSYADSGEPPTIQSKDKHEEKNQSIARPTELFVVKPSDGLGPGKAKAATAAAKNPSPSQQLTASSNKTARSFSFRDVLAGQQGNSTFPTAPHSDSSNRDKASAGSRAKSSPLRRIIDPILKPKALNRLSFDNSLLGLQESGSRDKHPSNEVLTSTHGDKSDSARSNSSPGPPAKSNLNFSPRLSANANEKQMGLKMHAHLQLACKNGLPLFTFTFNDSDILAAMMRKVYVSGKDDFEWVYTFYSIHEVKKKNRGWVNQGNKSKGYGYTSNVVGQMKISCPQCQKLSDDDCNNNIMVREFVLFDADLKHTAHDTLNFLPNSEHAAIVVKVPKEKETFDGDERQNDLSQIERARCLPKERDSCDLAENQCHSSIVVILPGGVHSQPATACVPATLIDRWRSGGSCDCGGWDVGCTLRVLTSHGQESYSLSSSQACHVSNGTHQAHLFVQGGAQENRHVFSLASFKERLYEVDFNSSISLLQAFSICIAILHGRKLANLSELSNLSEEKSLSEPLSTENDGIKAPNRTQREIPASYVPYPPHSPVGRV